MLSFARSIPHVSISSTDTQRDISRAKQTMEDNYSAPQGWMHCTTMTDVLLLHLTQRLTKDSTWSNGEVTERSKCQLVQLELLLAHIRVLLKINKMGEEWPENIARQLHDTSAAGNRCYGECKVCTSMLPQYRHSVDTENTLHASAVVNGDPGIITLGMYWPMELCQLLFINKEKRVKKLRKRKSRKRLLKYFNDCENNQFEHCRSTMGPPHRRKNATSQEASDHNDGHDSVGHSLEYNTDRGGDTKILTSEEKSTKTTNKKSDEMRNLFSHHAGGIVGCKNISCKLRHVQKVVRKRVRSRKLSSWWSCESPDVPRQAVNMSTNTVQPRVNTRSKSASKKENCRLENVRYKRKRKNTYRPLPVGNRKRSSRELQPAYRVEDRKDMIDETAEAVNHILPEIVEEKSGEDGYKSVTITQSKVVSAVDKAGQLEELRIVDVSRWYKHNTSSSNSLVFEWAGKDSEIDDVTNDNHQFPVNFADTQHTPSAGTRMPTANLFPRCRLLSSQSACRIELIAQRSLFADRDSLNHIKTPKGAKIVLKLPGAPVKKKYKRSIELEGFKNDGSRNVKRNLLSEFNDSPSHGDKSCCQNLTNTEDLSWAATALLDLKYQN